MKKSLASLVLALLVGCTLPRTPLATATPTDSNRPCYYMWAYQDLPEISVNYQAALHTILPEATASASVFGEDCVAEDGSSTFSAMETDFYVTIPARALADNETLGAQVEAVLGVTDRFSLEVVPGPNPGFVEFTFIADSERRILRVPIALGKELRAKGLRGADLLLALESH